MISGLESAISPHESLSTFGSGGSRCQIAVIETSERRAVKISAIAPQIINLTVNKHASVPTEESVRRESQLIGAAVAV